MHTHFTHFGFSHPLGERRLCHDAETLRNSQRLVDNTVIAQSRSLYDNRFLGAEFPELQNSVDRVMFRTLILNGMLGTSPPSDFSNVGLNQLNVLNPLNLGTTREEIGANLLRLLSTTQLNTLFPGVGHTDQELGAHFLDIQRRSDHTLRQSVQPGPQNLQSRQLQARDAQFQDFLRIPILIYTATKAKLNAILARHRIQVPGNETVDRPGVQLERTAYLALLIETLRGRENLIDQDLALQPDSPETKIKRLHERVQQLAKSDPEIGRAVVVYAPVSIEDLGTTEALGRFGIFLGMQTRRTYFERRRGIPRPPIYRPQQQPQYARLPGAAPQVGFTDPYSQTPFNGPVPPLLQPYMNAPPVQPVIQAPGQPLFVQQNGPISERQLTASMDSAATWREHPERAQQFLREMFRNGSMPQSGQNQAFIQGLEQYVMQNRVGGPFNGYTGDNIRAILDLMASDLVNTEETLRQTSTKSEEFRNQVTISQSVNNFAGEMGDILKDWQNNKVFAALLVVGGFFAVRGLFRWLKGPHRRVTSIALLAGFGGLMYGLYQQRKQGHAWWDTAFAGTQEFFKGESNRDPRDQTLTTYWTREIGMTGRENQQCFALLANENVNNICTFHDEMNRWRARGARESDRPRLSQLLPSIELGRYRAMFGETRTEAEIAQLMHTTLKGFFQNRGQKLAEVGFRYPNQNQGTEERGLQYIRDRYAQPVDFMNVLQGNAEVYGVSVEPILRDWNSPATQQTLAQLESRNPQAFMFIITLHEAYVEMQRNPGANRPWEFQYVMLFEADPGVLARQGQHGALAASWVEQVQRAVGDWRVRNGFFQPPAPDRADSGVQLLRPGSSEEVLITETFGDGRMIQNQTLNSVPVLAVRDRVRVNLYREWQDFATRLPVTDDARNLILADVQAQIYGLAETASLPTLVNKLELLRYRLLIAATRDNNRLSKEIVDRVRTRGNALEVSAMHAWWMNWLRLINTAAFPEMNTLEQVNQLFDINAQEPGGVRWYDVRRIFPAWQRSDFDRMRAQISGYSGQLQLMRRSPFLFNVPGQTPRTPAQVAAMETFLARRFATRIMEAVVTRHTQDGPTIVDAAQERYVTLNEQENLRQYFDQVYTSMVPMEPLRRIDRLNRKANDVATGLGVGDGLDVRILQTGQVIISLVNERTGDGSLITSPVSTITDMVNDTIQFTRENVTGSIPRQRFLLNEEYDPGFRTLVQGGRRQFRVPMSVEDFEAKTVPQIIEDWKTGAVAQKKAQILAAPRPIPLAVFDVVRQGDDVRYSADALDPFPVPPAVPSRAIASTPLLSFLRAAPETIIERYRLWESATERTPTDVGDPLVP